jgi:hypothetical protein
MPAGMREMLGIDPGAAGPATTPGDRSVFATLVQPVLREKCVRCHGEEKQEHRLRLDSYAAIMRGGQSGSNVVAGSASDSLLVQSLLLPENDKKHMPPKGKPQLDSDDVALLAWWIDQGASETAQPGDLKTTLRIQRILHDRLGESLAVAEELPMLDWTQAEPLAREIGERLGHVISPLAADSPALQLAVLPGDRTFSDAELAALLPLKANLVDLGLRGAMITDTGLIHVAQMKNLERLDLSQTEVTDAGIVHLSSLPHLEYLNLFGTKVTDAALGPLSEIKTLRKVFLWQTAVTTNGLSVFRQAFIDEGQLEEWQRDIEEIQKNIASMGVQVDIGQWPGDK